MAHFAQIDENNIVVQVVVTDNNDLNGDEGYQMLVDNLGGTWIKTSYNTFGGIHKLNGEPLRMNYAGVGFTYDPVRDAFIAPKPEHPYLDFILNQDTLVWEPDDSVQLLQIQENQNNLILC